MTERKATESKNAKFEVTIETADVSAVVSWLRTSLPKHGPISAWSKNNHKIYMVTVSFFSENDAALFKLFCAGNP